MGVSAPAGWILDVANKAKTGATSTKRATPSCLTEIQRGQRLGGGGVADTPSTVLMKGVQGRAGRCSQAVKDEAEAWRPTSENWRLQRSEASQSGYRVYKNNILYRQPRAAVRIACRQ